MFGVVTVLCLLLCIISPCQASDTGNKQERPNVLFILTEDQGAQLSFIGTPGLSTPNMDQLAKGGIYFNKAFVNYPLCSPSKASIYTGTYCHTSGLMGLTHNWHGSAETMPEAITNARLTKLNRIRDDLPTLVELLKEAGYSLAITAKLHVQPVFKFPYDHFIKGHPTYESVKEHFERAGEDGVPVFYLANISEPHRPHRNIDSVDIGIDVNAIELPGFLPETEACRKDWAEYLGHCQLADKWVGEVLRGLEDSGQKDNTVILFMGDHGPNYHRAKLSLYDLGIHVPLAFSGPGIQSGVITDQMISNVDLMPTLLDLCGLKDITPALQHGHSIAPLLRGEIDETGNEYIFAEIDHGFFDRDDGEGVQERCIYDGRWKLIYRENRTEPRLVIPGLKKDPNPNSPYQDNRVYDEISSRREEFPEAFRLLAAIDNGVFMPEEALPMFELYDRGEDPWELNNLADNPGHRNTLKRLLAQLQLWSVQTDDKYTVLKALSADTETLLQQLAAIEK